MLTASATVRVQLNLPAQLSCLEHFLRHSRSLKSDLKRSLLSLLEASFRRGTWLLGPQEKSGVKSIQVVEKGEQEDTRWKGGNTQ